jgi:hypothetical protein
LRISKNNLGRARVHDLIKEAEMATIRDNEAATIAEFEAEQQRLEARRQAMARPEEEDTPLEKAFRTIVRARFANLEVMGDEEIVSEAARLNLDETQALRVFDQEIARIEQEVVRNENIREYTEYLELLIVATGGIITKSERSALNAIAESLFLTADDIKAAEAEYVFIDESRE